VKVSESTILVSV